MVSENRTILDMINFYLPRIRIMAQKTLKNALQVGVSTNRVGHCFFSSPRRERGLLRHLHRLAYGKYQVGTDVSRREWLSNRHATSSAYILDVLCAAVPFNSPICQPSGFAGLERFLETDLAPGSGL
jgi:hypothetical protein